MDQKKFSRQLIVLRAIINGYSGHARLTQSPNGQELEIRVQSPSGMRALYAVIVERCEEGYRGCPLGALAVDERGQGMGAYSMEGLSVAPEILAIVEQSDDNCLLALSGFLSGSRDVNWAGVRSAACEAVATGECSDCVPGIQPRETDSPAAVTLPDEASEPDERDHSRKADAEPERRDSAEKKPDEGRSRRGADSAAEVAGIRSGQEWPEEIAALKPLFEAGAPVTPFPGSRYTFIAVPASASQPAFHAGIWARNGCPSRVAYAIRGESPTVAPQGLEGFLWRASADGGFWVAYLDAQTGRPVSGDY